MAGLGSERQRHAEDRAVACSAAQRIHAPAPGRGRMARWLD
jgi:hypothetical protein